MFRIGTTSMITLMDVHAENPIWLGVTSMITLMDVYADATSMITLMDVYTGTSSDYRRSSSSQCRKQT
jgi:hypothetical protein